MAGSAAVFFLLLVVAPALALVTWWRWRRAAARQEEVRRLARLAAEEAELGQEEAALAYYAEVFPRVVHPAEAPLWTLPVLAPAQEEAEVAPTPPAGAKGVCTVCYRPTTRRCKQCKAVKYCSFKCQIAHWRQGHKDECHPSSVDARPNGGIEVSGTKKGKFEQNSPSEENVVVGVEPVPKIDISAAARPESSQANHVAENSNNKSNGMPLEDASITVGSSEDGHVNNEVRPSRTTGQTSLIPDPLDSSGKETCTESAHLAKNVSYSNNLDVLVSLGKSQVGEHKIIGLSTSNSDEFIGSSKKDLKAPIFSCTACNEKSVNNSNFQGDGFVGQEFKSSRTKDAVSAAASSDGGGRPEQSQTEVSGTGNLKSSKYLSSTAAVDKVSSVLSGHSVTPNPCKRSGNHAKVSVISSESAVAEPNNLSTSMKKIVGQQTVPKVVRHYPSELTLFPYELFVKLYNFDKVEMRPFGLRNLGNSCYANAVLQCLAFTRPLAAYLLDGLHSKNCSKMVWCFMCEFEKLIVEGKRGKSLLSPTGILSHLRTIGSSFGPGKEEDAHEFLRYAIGKMQSVCMKEAKKIVGQQLAEETTLVQLIFGGYLRSKIKCTKCQVSSEQCERILDLTVEIDGDIGTLEEALHRFTSTEVLDGENRYQCSRCKSYERAKKKLTISEAPNILTIALKRYKSGKFGKISKAIRFPEILNLARYMSANDDNSPVYSLYAVVVHQDVMSAAFSGHYVCYVTDLKGQWYKTNDSQVEPVSLEKVLSKCAYMLFYARCSPRAPSTVRKAMIAQDPAHAKKVRQKVVNSGPTHLEGGSFLNKHLDHITLDLTYPYDTFGDTPCPLAQSPCPSESSSLFSNSDAGSFSTSSTDSTESTRNSTSTEEYDYIFGTSDQMYLGIPMVSQEESERFTHSRWTSGLTSSSSDREVDQTGEVERHHGASGGRSLSFLYTDQSRQQYISELTEQCRKVGETDRGTGEGRGSVLLRRPTRERTAQTFY